MKLFEQDEEYSLKTVKGSKYFASPSLQQEEFVSKAINKSHFLSGILGFAFTALLLAAHSNDLLGTRLHRVDMRNASHSRQILSAETKPTLHIVGDSTCAINGVAIGGPTQGWCEYVYQFVNVPVNNKALSGRSARTYTTEGDWDRLKPFIKAGDVVLIELGLNDEGDPSNDWFHRNDYSSWDSEASVVVEKWGKNETVHTYQWYVTRWINDIRAAGAIPLVSSSIVLNVWSEDRKWNTGARWLYPILARDTAKKTNSTYVNHNYAVHSFYEEVGFEAVQPFYPLQNDPFHLSPSGSDAVAAQFFRAFKCKESEALTVLQPYFTERATLLDPVCWPEE